MNSNEKSNTTSPGYLDGRNFIVKDDAATNDSFSDVSSPKNASVFELLDFATQQDIEHISKKSEKISKISKNPHIFPIDNTELAGKKEPLIEQKEAFSISERADSTCFELDDLPNFINSFDSDLKKTKNRDMCYKDPALLVNRLVSPKDVCLGLANQDSINLFGKSKPTVNRSECTLNRPDTCESTFSQQLNTDDVNLDLFFEGPQSNSGNDATIVKQDCPFLLPAHTLNKKSNSKVNDTTKGLENNSIYEALQDLDINPNTPSEEVSKNVSFEHPKLQKSFSFDVFELSCKINILFTQRDLSFKENILKSHDKKVPTTLDFNNTKVETNANSHTSRPSFSTPCHSSGVLKQQIKNFSNSESWVDVNNRIDPIFFNDNIENSSCLNSGMKLNHSDKTSSNNLEDFCMELDIEKSSNMLSHDSCALQFSNENDLKNEDLNNDNLFDDHIFKNNIDNIECRQEDNKELTVIPTASESDFLTNFDDSLMKINQANNIRNSPPGVLKLRSKIYDSVVTKSRKSSKKKRRFSKKALSTSESGITKKSDEKLLKTNSGSEKIFHCESNDCNITFNRKDHAKRHYRTIHSDSKPYECDVCQKRFSRNDNMLQHFKTHFKEGRR